MALRLLMFLTVMPMLHACHQNASPLPLVGTLERDRIAMVAEVSERIVAVPVTEGQFVEMGQVVMQLDSHRQKVEMRRVEAERDAARQRLAELIRGPRPESIREMRARLQGAEENLEIRTRELGRISDLVGRGLVAENDLDQALNARESADAEVESLGAALDALLEGTTAEELGQAQARLEAAEAALEAAGILVDRMTIRAPRSGRIETIQYKLGAQPRVGDTVVSMLADQAPYARVFIPEALRARVQPGTGAVVTVDGIAETFAGRVRYVAAEAAFTPYYALTERDRGRLSFLAEVTLTDDTAQALPSGVAVEVDFPELRE